jgi:hypothetical protein
MSLLECIRDNSQALLHVSYQEVKSDSSLNILNRNYTSSYYYSNVVKLIYDDSLNSRLDAVNCSIKIMKSNKVLNLILTRDRVFSKVDRIELLWV